MIDEIHSQSTLFSKKFIALFQRHKFIVLFQCYKFIVLLQCCKFFDILQGFAAQKAEFRSNFRLKSSKIQLLGCLLAFLVFSALDDDFISVYVAGKSLFKRAFIGFVEKLLVCKLCYKLINKAF